MIAVLIAGAVAMLLSLFGTRALISFFDSIGKGQPILGSDDNGPVHHMKKQGTATMGGIAIMLSAFVGWLVAHLRGGIALSDQAMIMWVICGLLSVVGFLDDYLKVRRSHNRGLLWKRKGYLTFALIAILMTWLLVGTGVNETLSFTRFDFPGWNLSPILWVLWTSIMVWATTNAVNVTDGLDGLAAGSALFGFLAFTVIAYWAFRNPDVYHLVNPLDLAVFSAAMAGACGGFLWWNAAPARIFMGDVGALGIGAALGLLAVTTNTHLLLPLICALNVMEAGSVALQMGVFKASGRKKRLFRMSPIHHHFELLGWPETTVIIRFWILSGICVAVAVGMFIADFTHIADSFVGK
jgi:phospho-N-acetylmuramoyl-pentapeptide-transferase